MCAIFDTHRHGCHFLTPKHRRHFVHPCPWAADMVVQNDVCVHGPWTQVLCTKLKGHSMTLAMAPFSRPEFSTCGWWTTWSTVEGSCGELLVFDSSELCLSQCGSSFSRTLFSTPGSPKASTKASHASRFFTFPLSGVKPESAGHHNNCNCCMRELLSWSLWRSYLGTLSVLLAKLMWWAWCWTVIHVGYNR